MRKIIYLILSTVILTTLVGCQNSAKPKDANNQIKIEKKTKTVKITPLKVENDHDLKNDQIISIKYKIKNISKKKTVVAASDFIIKSGESYYYMGEGINFAKTIKAHQSVTGTGYYKIPKELKKFTLMFHPVDSKENAQWKLKLKE
ncbi:DUF4352 domain-containing protein [Lactobacillus sp. YT155]|uniref:DUF4352 domain-containing protein n=1 Tax=Lactobacillus sp. YT155 TaxID=3060955 RepID=UPI00265F0209|nr:DUF4352 domain-containing protein [Lactobacillus sp. YT155]MDO1604843.1 DUF4352 domain-containing protein [Lactobacillus sp. YT155]